MRRIVLAVMGSMLLGCVQVPGINPYDPDTPEGRRAKAIIAGRAAYPDRDSAAGIVVSVIRDDGSKAADLREVGPDGSFSIEVASGNVTVHLTAPLYGTLAVGPLALQPGETRDLGTLILPVASATSRLRGRVEVSGGLPTDGVRVALRRVDAEGACTQEVAFQQLGASGAFEFNPIPPGEYVAIAAADGATMAVSELARVNSDETRELSAALPLRLASDALQIRASGVQPARYAREREVEVMVEPFGGMEQIRTSLDATFATHGVRAEWQTLSSANAVTLDDADGEQSIFVQFRRRARQDVANAEPCLLTQVYSLRVALDRVAPVIRSVLIHNASAVIGDDRAAVSVHVEADDNGGVAGIQLLRDEADPVATPWEAVPGAPVDTTMGFPPAEGVYRVRVRLRDRAGNETPVESAHELNVVRDLSDPAAPVDLELTSSQGKAVVGQALSARTNDPLPTLSFRAGGADPAPVEFRVELSAGSDFSQLVPLVAPAALGGGYAITVGQPLRDGAYRWRAVARDRAGREAESATFEFVVDTAGPPAPAFLSVNSPTTLPVEIRVPPTPEAASIVVRIDAVPNPREPDRGIATSAGGFESVLTPGPNQYAVAVATGPQVDDTMAQPMALLNEIGLALMGDEVAPYGTFVVSATPYDLLGNPGVAATTLMELDLSAPLPVLLDDFPPAYTNQPVVTARIQLSPDTPHVKDPSFLRYETCAEMMTGPAVPGSPTTACAESGYAAAPGNDGFLVPLVARTGGEAANPNTLNRVCVRTRDRAGNVSQADCRVVALDQVAPLAPRLATTQPEVIGNTVVMWLVERPCPLAGRDVPFCDANPDSVEARGGLLADFTALANAADSGRALSVGIPLMEGAEASPVEFRLVDRAGNTSPAVSGDVKGASTRVLFTLDPDFTLGEPFTGSNNPRITAASGTAFFIAVGTVPGVAFTRVVAQPSDMPDVTSDVGVQLMPGGFKDFNRMVTVETRMGAYAASAGELSWLIDEVAQGTDPVGLKADAIAVVSRLDHDGRFDIRNSFTSLSFDPTLDCRYGVNSLCQQGRSFWPTRFGHYFFSESASDGRSMVLTTPSMKRNAMEGETAGEVTITGPHFLGLDLTPSSLGVFPGALELPIDIPAGTRLYNGYYELSAGEWRHNQFSPGQPDREETIYFTKARGGGREYMELSVPRAILRNRSLVGLIIPEGVTVTIPLVSNPGVLDGITINGMVSRSLASRADALLFPQVDPLGPDSLDSSEAVPGLVLWSLSGESDGAAATLLDFGDDQLPSPVPLTERKLAAFAADDDDRQERLMEEPGRYRPQPVAGPGGLILPPEACAMVLKATEDKVIRRIRVRGKGNLDQAKVFVWEQDSTSPFSDYTPTSNGERFLFPSQPGTSDCSDLPGGCDSVETDDYRIGLVAGRHYLFVVGVEVFENNVFTEYGWPASAPLVQTGAEASQIGFAEILGEATRVLPSYSANGPGVAVLDVVRTPPRCNIELEVADRVSYGRPAVNDGVVAFQRRAEQPGGPSVTTMMVGAGRDGQGVRREDMRAVATLEPGTRVLATAVHRRIVRWLDVGADGRNGRLMEQDASVWPPKEGPLVRSQLDEKEPFRALLASLDGNRLAVAGEGPAGIEVRVLALESGSPADPLRRIPLSQPVRALVLAGDDLFMWISEGPNGGQLLHRDLGELTVLHPGSYHHVTTFSVRADEDSGVATVLAALAPEDGPLISEVVELREPKWTSRLVVAGDLRLHPTLLGNAAVMLRMPAVRAMDAVDSSEIRVVFHPLDGAAADASADTDLSAASALLTSAPTMTAGEWRTQPVLAAAGDTLVVVGRSADGSGTLALFDVDDQGIATTVFGPLGVGAIEGLQTSPTRVFIARTSEDPFLLARAASGAWSQIDVTASALGITDTSVRLLGITGESLVATLAPPALPGGPTPAPYSRVLMFSSDEAGTLQQQWQGRLPALTHFHRFASVAKAGNGDLLLYDSDADPDILWRLDAAMGTPSLVGPSHRPFSAITESLGVAAAPRLAGSALYFLSERAGGLALVRYRTVQP